MTGICLTAFMRQKCLPWENKYHCYEHEIIILEWPKNYSWAASNELYLYTCVKYIPFVGLFSCPLPSSRQESISKHNEPVPSRVCSIAFLHPCLDSRVPPATWWNGSQHLWDFMFGPKLLKELKYVLDSFTFSCCFKNKSLVNFTLF